MSAASANAQYSLEGPLMEPCTQTGCTGAPIQIETFFLIEDHYVGSSQQPRVIEEIKTGGQTYPPNPADSTRTSLSALYPKQVDPSL